jgi:predicted nucleic acid-binding protein
MEMTSPHDYFLDACIPIYAAGTDHPYRRPCLGILAAVEEGALAAVTDTEVIQEIVYHFRSRERASEGVRLALDFLDLVQTVLPVTRETAVRFLGLQQEYPFLPPRDALHVAVMIGAGIERIVTADRHFDQVREVQRVDPLDLKW